MMLISMILDPEACISDAGFFRVGRTNGRTYKPILGVGLQLDLVVGKVPWPLKQAFITNT